MIFPLCLFFSYQNNYYFIQRVLILKKAFRSDLFLSIQTLQWDLNRGLKKTNRDIEEQDQADRTKTGMNLDRLAEQGSGQEQGC